MSTLSTAQFKEIAALAQDRWGLELTERKKLLVQSRLSKMLHRSQYKSVADYLEHLRNEADEEDMLVFFDLLSTNTTSFFRESEHFDYLEQHVYPRLADAPRGTSVRVWSAACSNGSEPYTIGIHAHECLPNLAALDYRILATDLSNKVIERARLALYPDKAVESLPARLRGKYFEKRHLPDTPPDEFAYRVVDSVRSMVSIHRLNLMDPWPMKGPFDVIFLRNVMIYFNKPTREKLVNRMRTLLSEDGLLIIGGAETLSGIDSGFTMIRPSIYAVRA
ncbi:MAG: protein-glutamate O-methyltransferase CheR [Phycisphaerales bacterium]|nr:protein-glutamate O-methyltransferase CheR [Phycisphaerales bacterium]